MLKVIDYTKPTRNPSLKEKFDYLVLSTGYVERLLKKKKLDMINEFIESQETKLKLYAIYAKNTLHGVEGLDTSVLDNIFEQKSDLYSFLVFSCKDEKKEDLISWSMSFMNTTSLFNKICQFILKKRKEIIKLIIKGSQFDDLIIKFDNNICCIIQ